MSRLRSGLFALALFAVALIWGAGVDQSFAQKDTPPVKDAPML